MKIAAVVVTYNRLKLLRECIAALRKQTHRVDEIIVVNNGSTDGTAEWLSGEKDLFTISQGNVGGAGGFYTGMKAAYERGHDWIWIMDDDVFPQPDALDNMLTKGKELRDKNKRPVVPVPLRLFEDESFADLPAYEWDLKGTFVLHNLGRKPLNMVYDRISALPEDMEVLDLPFEGPLIPREALDKVGLPSKEFFIYGDDSDYSFRLRRAGFDLVLVRSARFYRMIKPGPGSGVPPWKMKYFTRNTIWLGRLYGENWLVRNIRTWLWALRFIVPFTLRGRLFHDRETFRGALLGLWNGFFGKLPEGEPVTADPRSPNAGVE